MTCKHLMNGAPDCVFCHRDQLKEQVEKLQTACRFLWHFGQPVEPSLRQEIIQLAQVGEKDVEASAPKPQYYYNKQLMHSLRWHGWFRFTWELGGYRHRVGPYGSMCIDAEWYWLNDQQAPCKGNVLPPPKKL